MSLQGIAFGLVALVASSALCFAYGEYDGNKRGKAKVQAKWDKQTSDRVIAETKSLREDRDKNLTMAVEYEAALNDLQGRYDRLARQRTASAKLTVVCPASGQVGDVVVPAAFVRSLFNIEPADPAAPGPAASSVDYRLRRGASAPSR